MSGSCCNFAIRWHLDFCYTMYFCVPKQAERIRNSMKSPVFVRSPVYVRSSLAVERSCVAADEDTSQTTTMNSFTQRRLIAYVARSMLLLACFLAILPLGSCFMVSSSPHVSRHQSRQANHQLNMLSSVLNTESPRQIVLQGMQRFRQADVPGSIELFDKAERLDTSLRPFLWQRGISYYYANRFQEGSDQVNDILWNLCKVSIHSEV